MWKRPEVRMGRVQASRSPGRHVRDKRWGQGCPTFLSRADGIRCFGSILDQVAQDVTACGVTVPARQGNG